MAKETLIDIFWKRVKEMPERTAIMHKVNGSYAPVQWGEHGRITRLVANGLLAYGLERGDKIAIMSQTRPAWTWADIGALSCGAVTVPIYPTLSPPEVQYLVKHSDTTILFAEQDWQAKKILDSVERPPQLKMIVIIEGDAPPSTEHIVCITWDQLLKQGEKYQAEHPDEVDARVKEVQPSDLASIIYTSGTTGVPKGAMLLHSNFYSVCRAMTELVGFTENDLALSFLPLSHVYERVGGQFLSIYQGLVMAYAESIESVPKNMIEVQPTVLNGVPRFYEKAYQRIQMQIKDMAKPQQILIRWAFGLNKRATKVSGDNSALLKQFYRGELRVADRLVFSKIRKRFGGRLRIMVSGAAPLSQEVQSFFESLGFEMVEGYGLTETSAPIACNTPEANHHGTVGKPLPGVQVKIAADGEILAKGPTIFAGYYKNEEATKDALNDGWFYTGDIGEVDAEGFLHIKDRKKDIIITAGGKHIAPQYLENMFKGQGMVSNIVVYGDRRKYCTALITLNPDALKKFAKDNGIKAADGSDLEDTIALAQNSQVYSSIERLVNEKNEHLAQFEKIKKFSILPVDFSAETNELTPTFKVKRKVVIEKYKDVLDKMYDAQDLELEDGRTAKTGLKK
ncbi:MAG TPA: long-chain fatty acid--CoA ligase [Oculatellaceae cyanobacterium]